MSHKKKGRELVAPLTRAWANISSAALPLMLSQSSHDSSQSLTIQPTMAITAAGSMATMAAGSMATTVTGSRKKPISWEKDAVGDGRCSADILLDWYTAPGNLHRWWGDKGRVTKEVLANEIVALLNAEGITHRDSKGKVLYLLISVFCNWDQDRDLLVSTFYIWDQDLRSMLEIEIISMFYIWDRDQSFDRYTAKTSWISRNIQQSDRLEKPYRSRDPCWWWTKRWSNS